MNRKTSAVEPIMQELFTNVLLYSYSEKCYIIYKKAVAMKSFLSEVVSDLQR